MTKMSKTENRVPKFASELKALRLAKNMSLRDCEKKTGNALSRQTFLRAEQGSVTLENLFRILTVYGVTVKSPQRAEFVEWYHAAEVTKAQAAA